eukprot:2918878-Amphidinium_carterae.1
MELQVIGLAIASSAIEHDQNMRPKYGLRIPLSKGAATVTCIAKLSNRSFPQLLRDNVALRTKDGLRVT